MTKHDLARVEAALANYLGPIAGLIVERASARASTFEVLYQRVAWEIEDEDDRASFLRDMAQAPESNGGDDIREPRTEILITPELEATAREIPSYAFDAEFLSKIEAELIPKLGNAAVQMVREAAQKAHNEAQFYLVLARLMPDKRLRDRILSRAISVRTGRA
jgi:serine/threonine-protein kinase